MTEKDKRPSPDELLKEAKAEHSGKLKIFLGAAPGVGKTYAMLSAARNRLSEGVDVVIGIVETHQRSETENLAQGIPSIDRQQLNYRGLVFDEMDIDAILKRKPKLVLVDELAHTNIPGARHPKRYQDVQEILESGIDVYSTLNVQHIESLNDIVSRITGVTVRETVPDSLMQAAHSLELIDLPPDELLQRLKEGKVYIPEQARLAVNRFFTPGNLTALRELALRQAAERVDDQMTSYMRRHAITGPWPTSNRVMVCISDDRQAASLVRTARRSAERRQAPWLVIYIETSRHSFLPESARNDIAQAMTMAENMGAETMVATGDDIAHEILRIARDRNVSTIIIGKSIRSLWSRILRPSVASTILNQSEGFDILLVNNKEGARTSGPEAKRMVDGESQFWKPNWITITKTFLIVLVTSIIAWGSSLFVISTFLPFLFIIAILFVVLDLGLSAALFAIALSCLPLELLLTAPNFSLFPQNRENFVALVFYFATSLILSLIANRLHWQNKITSRNAERTQSLYDFAKNIAAAATIDDVAQSTVRRIATALGARTAILIPRHDRLEIIAAIPADLHLDTASNAAMDWAWRHHKPAGWKSDTLPGAAFYGLPLRAGGNTLGVLAVRFESGESLSPDQDHFLTSLAYQAATAIERAKLVTDVAQARLQTETEKLRASLLSSISHDLRDPLDIIINIIRGLNSNWDDIQAEERRPLLGLIAQEADRLDRFVENFLDMTTLVTGNVKLSYQKVDLRNVIDQSITKLARVTESRTFDFTWDPNLPLIDGDEKILQRVFVNLIENACSYSLQTDAIKIEAIQQNHIVQITITDNGPGIPESERERVFDMFYRAKGGTVEGAVSGVGLGLSICRGFVEMHKGQIRARSGEDGKGTRIVVRLPISSDELELGQ